MKIDELRKCAAPRPVADHSIYEASVWVEDPEAQVDCISLLIMLKKKCPMDKI
jgi:hypothetical protein